MVKFGGSVLDDEKAAAQVASLIRETRKSGLGVVVVVSAMKGVTDQLLAMSKKVNPNMEPRLQTTSSRPGRRRARDSSPLPWKRRASMPPWSTPRPPTGR